MRLTAVHRAVGMGQQIQAIMHGRKLLGVELILSLNGDTFLHEKNRVDYFPQRWRP